MKFRQVWQEELGGEGNLAEDRVTFIWRGDLSQLMDLNCISYFKLHYSNSNLIVLIEANGALEPRLKLKYDISAREMRENPIQGCSHTLSLKLYFGPSLVINYSILLGHICLDKVNVKLIDFETKQMYKFFVFVF